MVHPHLEDCVQFWFSHLKKGIEEKGKVQRSATKMIRHMEGFPYGEGLPVNRLRLFSLEKETFDSMISPGNESDT